MAESIMLNRAKDFAVEIINMCKDIKETKRESVLTNQLKQMRQYPNSPELSKIAVYRRCRS